MSRLIYCGNCGSRRSQCTCPVPTPEQMAPFAVIDGWLRARGWEDTGGGWKSRTKARVTIASHEEAQRIQRRRDRSARPRRSRVQEMAEAKWPPRWAEAKPGSMEIVTFKADVEAREETIRAVCEYLRAQNIGPMAAVLPTGVGSAADAIEREFLESR